MTQWLPIAIFSAFVSGTSSTLAILPPSTSISAAVAPGRAARYSKVCELEAIMGRTLEQVMADLSPERRAEVEARAEELLKQAAAVNPKGAEETVEEEIRS